MYSEVRHLPIHLACRSTFRLIHPLMTMYPLLTFRTGIYPVGQTCTVNDETQISIKYAGHQPASHVFVVIFLLFDNNKHNLMEYGTLHCMEWKKDDIQRCAVTATIKCPASDWAHNISVALRHMFQRPLLCCILSHACLSLTTSRIQIDI